MLVSGSAAAARRCRSADGQARRGRNEGPAGGTRGSCFSSSCGPPGRLHAWPRNAPADCWGVRTLGEWLSCSSARKSSSSGSRPDSSRLLRSTDLRLLLPEARAEVGGGATAPAAEPAGRVGAAVAAIRGLAWPVERAGRGGQGRRRPPGAGQGDLQVLPLARAGGYAARIHCRAHLEACRAHAGATGAGA